MIDGLRVLGLIPARGGSKGVPGKNIRDLAGKPLIAYVIEVAREVSYLDDLIVSTDSEEIREVAQSFGARVPFIRPPEFATDTAKAIGVIQHALEFAETERGVTYDIIAYLEPPTPLRTSEDINKGLEMFAEARPDSLVSVNEANQFHPILMKQIVDRRLTHIWKPEPEGVPRQLYSPTAYMRNGAVYVFRSSLIRQGILYGEDVLPYVMPVERSICIDDLADWHTAESLVLSLQR